jgi:hypothetical protein
MNEDDLIFSKSLQQKGVTRRSLIRGATGAAAGAGLMLSSGLSLPALEDDEHNNCRVLARPIPHITGPGHFFFPGPPDGSAPSSFPHFPNAGFDPSTITDFKGVIANADLNFAGTGTDLNTGNSTPYTFHTDWRFYKGTFVSIVGHMREGTLSFI